MTQPGRILLSETSGLAKPSGDLPGQAKGGESRDFDHAALIDADFSQLLAEIGNTGLTEFGTRSGTQEEK
jgi:hypothetical protein